MATSASQKACHKQSLHPGSFIDCPHSNFKFVLLSVCLFVCVCIFVFEWIWRNELTKTSTVLVCCIWGLTALHHPHSVNHHFTFSNCFSFSFVLFVFIFVPNPTTTSVFEHLSSEFKPIQMSNAVETSAEISMAISKGWTWPSSKKFVPTYRPPPFSQTLPFPGPIPLSKSCLRILCPDHCWSCNSQTISRKLAAMVCVKCWN